MLPRWFTRVHAVALVLRVRALVFLRARVSAGRVGASFVELKSRVRMPHSHHHPATPGNRFGLAFMSARQPGAYDEVARKWHALTARRQAHLEELRDSGRWRHYYTWDKLIEALHEAAATRETWARLAGFSPDELQAGIQSGLQDGIQVGLPSEMHGETSGPPRGMPADSAPDGWPDVKLFFRKAG
jgi:hypothetical protein